jgi:hypothetical protein
MDSFSFIRGDGVMHQLLTTFTASHATNAHATDFTDISCHVVLQVVERNVSDPIIFSGRN